MSIQVEYPGLAHCRMVIYPESTQDPTFAIMIIDLTLARSHFLNELIGDRNLVN